MQEICSCSVKQSREKGFLTFIQGQGYDLDKIIFHTDKRIDGEIRESIRSTYFKKKSTGMKNKKNIGGKEK